MIREFRWMIVVAWVLTVTACASRAVPHSVDPPASVDAAVADAGEASDATLADDSTWPDGAPPYDESVIPPRLTAVMPTRGSASGGGSALLFGDHFSDDMVVRFGEAQAVVARVLSDDLAQVVVPPGELGKVTIQASNAGGLAQLTDAFTYEAATACDALAYAPAQLAADVPVVVRPALSFRTTLDPASLGSAAIGLSRLGEPREAVAHAPEVAGDTLTIVPDEALTLSSTYLLTVDGLRDASGHACAPTAAAFETVRPRYLPIDVLRAAPADRLAQSGNLLYVSSASFAGMQIYDVKNPVDPQILAEHRTLHPPTNITLRDHFAYVPLGPHGLEIIDISSPLRPVRVATLPAEGNLVDALVFTHEERTYLALAETAAGARIVDITEPTAAFTVARIEAFGAGESDTRALFMHESTLAVAEGSNGWALVSLENPAAPEVLASSTRINRQAVDVAIANGKLFVSLFPQTVASFELADIAWASATSKVFELPNDSTFRLTELSVSGDEVFVAAGVGGVLRLDASTLANRVDYTTPRWTTSVLVRDDYLIAGEEGGPVVFERATPSLLRYRPPNGAGLSNSIALADEHAYVATVSNGVQIFDLTQTRDPLTFISAFNTLGGTQRDKGAYAVRRQDDVLAVADGRAGLALYDITDRLTPALLWQGPESGVDLVTALDMDDSVLVACNDNNDLFLLSWREPETSFKALPLSLATDDQCLSVHLAGGSAFVARKQGLTMFDVSDAVPSPVSVRVPGERGVLGVATSGTTMYAITRTPDPTDSTEVSVHLRSYDITDPTSPQETWASPELSGGRDVTVRGPFLFLALGADGVSIYDVRAGAAPVLLGTYQIRGAARDIELGRDGAYVSLMGGGVAKLFTGTLP